MRDAVQTTLGARVRYRARTKENPFAVDLNAEWMSRLRAVYAINATPE